MEWKIIITNFLAAFIIFLIWFVTALLSGWAFDKSGEINKFVLVVNILVILGVFVGATVRSSIEMSKTKEVEVTPKNVKPDISCIMEYPIKVENNQVFRYKRNPEIIIKNNGPFKAVSLSADIKIYVYNTQHNNISQFIDTGFKSFDSEVLERELDVFDEIKHSLIGFTGKDSIAIYLVRISYHRKSDMKSFSLKEYFFIQNEIIYNNKEFEKNDLYLKIIKKVESYIPSKSGGVKITAAKEHVWFAESDGSVATKINDEGKLVIRTPEEQGDIKQDGYPFLEIKPVKFKATGFYTDAKIVDDHVEIIIPFKAKNIGDSAANLTENGFDITNTIDPGKALYTKKIIWMKLKEDSKITLEDYLNKFDTNERMFKYRFFVYYIPADKPDKLFKVVVHYNIGKNGFDPVITAPNNRQSK